MRHNYIHSDPTQAEWPDHLIHGGVAFSVLSILHGTFKPFSDNYPALIPNGSTGVLYASLPVLLGLLGCLIKRRLPRTSLEGWFFALSVLLLSEIPTRWPTVFHGGIGVIHLALVGIIAALILPRLQGAKVGVLLWGLGAAAGYVGLQEATGGALLYADDHPVFLYRLLQLKEHFPNIPFYYPMWNAGVEAREYFPSGMFNFTIILLPIIALLDVVAWYNQIVALLFFVVHPACTYFAVRVLKLNAPFAPLISLFASVLWFRYQFQYGTLGFLTSIALTPLVYALLVRVAEQGERTPWKTVFALIAVTSLCLLWTPSVFVLAPVALALFVPLLKFLLSRKGAVFLIALVLINLPWLLIFLEASQVVNFMATPHEGTKRFRAYPGLHELFTEAREHLRSAAPAIVFLVVPGLLAMYRMHRVAARAWGCAIILLFLVGLFLPPFKPRLELERMMIVSVYLSSIPVACALSMALRATGVRRVIMGMGVGSLLLTPIVLYVFTSLRTLERYAPSYPGFERLAASIKEHHYGGRIAFSGYTHHQLGGGHVALFPLLTEIPLYASRYQHDRFGHPDFIPTPFRKEHDFGVEKFFHLFNITAIIAHDHEWPAWFAARPHYYEKVDQGSDFTMYRRRNPPKGWFLEGEGEVIEQHHRELVLKLRTESALISYNFIPFLVVEGCEKMEPQEVYESIQFIQLSGCRTGEPIRIKARGIWERIFRRIRSAKQS